MPIKGINRLCPVTKWKQLYMVFGASPLSSHSQPTSSHRVQILVPYCKSYQSPFHIVECTVPWPRKHSVHPHRLEEYLTYNLLPINPISISICIIPLPVHGFPAAATTTITTTPHHTSNASHPQLFISGEGWNLIHKYPALPHRQSEPRLTFIKFMWLNKKCLSWWVIKAVWRSI